MIRRPPKSTRTDTLFPYTTLFRSQNVISQQTCGAIIPSMNTTWTILTGRFGSDVRNPCKDDLRYALDQLFNETDPDISQAPNETHPEARIRWAQNNDQLFVHTANSHGHMTFEQWDDQAMDEVMAPRLQRDNVTDEQALPHGKKHTPHRIPELKNITT